MANFINYRNIDFKLDGGNFYAKQINLSAQASVEPVLLSDGTLLNYAPQSAIIGSLNCEFYLTGALPSFLRITGSDESAITANFAGVAITGVYPKSISFSVESFQPITISAQFDWYGNVQVEDFSEQLRQRALKPIPEYIASAYKSYLDTDNIFGDNGDKFGNLISFSCDFNCDRLPFYHVDELIPFRVAKSNKRCEIKLSSNNLGQLISVDGKSVSTQLYIKDFYGTLLDSFPVSGVLTNQNYNVSEGQYMLTDATVEQIITESKVLV
jgi:hypothetical protein